MTPQFKIATKIALVATVAAASRPAAAAPDINAADALAHVKTLADPAWEGRGALTTGLVRAGDYIAGRFASWGLQPAGDGGTYFEAVEFPMRGSFGAATRLAPAATPDAAFTLGKDFSPNLGSSNSMGLLPVVFAGYGISVPGAYDDYAGLDVRGRAVLVLRYAPGYDEKTREPASPALAGKATLGAKVAAAIAHGAAAILIVDPPAQGPDKINPLAAVSARREHAIPSFHISRAMADRLLEPTGRTVAALQSAIDAARRPISPPPPAASAIAFNVEGRVVRSRNVVALLPGSDPALRPEVIVVGAHYDHLGRGDEGGSLSGEPKVHPGADDNASGTSAMLEVAEALALAPVRPRRSVVFVAFTGEEKGLLGSAAFARRVAERHVVGMINMDMVGRMQGNALEVEGAYTGDGLKDIIEAANTESLALKLPDKAIPNSDHKSFIDKKIPSVFMFTGLHADYHRPADTWDKVNAEGIARVSRLAERITVALADRRTKLAYVPVKWTSLDAHVGGQAGEGVRLGIMPDYQATDRMRVDGVMPGRIAERAGIKGGDVILMVGDKATPTLDAYMTVMSALKPGQTVTIVVERDGKKLTLADVKLTAAP